jgi:hypothetical protein
LDQSQAIIDEPESEQRPEIAKEFSPALLSDCGSRDGYEQKPVMKLERPGSKAQSDIAAHGCRYSDLPGLKKLCGQWIRRQARLSPSFVICHLSFVICCSDKKRRTKDE